MVNNFLPAFDMDEEMTIDKRLEENLAAIQADIRVKNTGVRK